MRVGFSVPHAQTAVGMLLPGCIRLYAALLSINMYWTAALLCMSLLSIILNVSIYQAGEAQCFVGVYQTAAAVYRLIVSVF